MQSGAPAGHSAAEAQARHFSVPTSQTGLLPWQAPVEPAWHCTHVPAAEQTGAVAGQSAAPAQARQACVVASQIGVPPAQSAASRQPTHWPAPVSHSALAPVHAVLFVAEHWPHAPDGWQTAVTPPQSPSPAQVRQLCAVASQTGLLPPH
jgi:hypothetical protein